MLEFIISEKLDIQWFNSIFWRFKKFSFKI